MNERLQSSWRIGDVELPNRAVLAPLAGIGNWFVRLQAKRYGAGYVVSEMVSSHGLAYGDRRTTSEFLRMHPDEHPLGMQLFGADAAIMREAAAQVAEAGASVIDLNMGCPVKKVCKTGAGSAMLADPDNAVAVARAAVEGGGRPVTVKLRPGRLPGDREGVRLAHRLVEEAGVAGIAFHPRHSSQQHKGAPDYALAAQVVESLPVPVVVSGGLLDAPKARRVFDQTGAAAVMIARGGLGNPWIFEQLLGARQAEPSVAEVLDELSWLIDRAGEHYEDGRAARYLRKFYPWYLETLRRVEPAEFTKARAHEIGESLQRTENLSQARAVLASVLAPASA